MTDLATIQELSATGRHQECLQACQSALQVNPEETYAYKYAGKSLLALGQFEKAQQCLVKAHQLDDSDPEIAKDIGNIFLNLGNQDIALEWYKKALEIDNYYASAFNNIASLKRLGGNHQEAIDLFKQAIQADPKMIQAYAGAAASFLALGDLDQAESFSFQAIAINKCTPRINEILGIVYQNKSNPDQAIEFYQKELEVSPQASISLLNLGLLLLQKGQAEAAVESLSKASALAPSEQCSLFLAQAYQNLGQLKEAIVEYKKLDINQSKDQVIPFNLGLCLLNTGNNIDAIEAFNLAVQLDDSFVAAWGNLGNSLKGEGRLKEAIQATKKVLALDPDNHTAHMNLGGIYKDLGQLDQALTSTLKSLELKPDNPDALINLGGIYKELEQLDQALASTLKSLELKPDNPDALTNLGGIYKDLGQLDQALASTLKSLELKPDNPDALTNLGGIYKDLGQLDQALSYTLKSLELKPDNPDALTNLGGIYKDLGQLDQALSYTLKSLELKPDNPAALTNLGGIYKDLGQLDQALSYSLKSLELKPDNPTAHTNLGGIYKDLGQLDQALSYTLKSLELKPDNPDTHTNLGGIYKKLGQLDQALSYTLKSLELKPDNADALINLGLIYKDLGQLDQALSYTLKSLELKPDNTKAHMNLGGIYTGQGLHSLSRKSYFKAWTLEPYKLELYLAAHIDCCSIYADNDQIERFRKNLFDIIAKIKKDTKLIFADTPLPSEIFQLAYQNKDDDRLLLESLADALLNNKSIQKCLGSKNNNKPSKISHKNIKIAIISDFPGDHAVGNHFSNLFNFLIDSQMEVKVFGSTPPRKLTQATKEKHEIAYTQLPNSISASCSIIKTYCADIVLFAEIGMSLHTLTLALARMAPVQAVMSGHPSTSGMKSIDYFISSELLECPGNQKFYTEQLVLLKKLPSTMKFPILPKKIISRSEMGLPESQVLIGFPHSLFKIHPDFDHILEAIAKKNKNVKYIFVNSPHKYLAGEIQKRWMNSAPLLLSHSIFLNTMPIEKFLLLLSNLDFILDPLYFGSGTVFMHSIAVGTPVVSMPTTQMRSRGALGCYKQMKMANPPIADCIQDYIQLCYELSISASAREKLREQIHASKHHLFDNAEVLYQWRQFIVDAVRCSNRGVKLPIDWRPS